MPNIVPPTEASASTDGAQFSSYNAPSQSLAGGLGNIKEDPDLLVPSSSMASSAAGLVADSVHSRPSPLRKSRLVPRGPTTGNGAADELHSISASPTGSDFEGEDEGNDGIESSDTDMRRLSRRPGAGVGAKRMGAKPNGRMSMLDFLSAEPPRGWNDDEPDSRGLPTSSSIGGVQQTGSATKRAPSVPAHQPLASLISARRKSGSQSRPSDASVNGKPKVAKRASMLVPRPATADRNSILSASSLRSPSTGSSDVHAAPPVPPLPSDKSAAASRSADPVRSASMPVPRDSIQGRPANGATRSAVASSSDSEMTAFEFLHAHEAPKVAQAPLEAGKLGSKGKERAAGNAFLEQQRNGMAGSSSSSSRKRRVEVRVVPRMDCITMFGSTQTSSNYSLSGTVVLKVNPPQPQESRIYGSDSGEGGLLPIATSRSSQDGGVVIDDSSDVPVASKPARARKDTGKTDAQTMEKDLVSMLTGAPRESIDKRSAKTDTTSPVLPPIIRDRSDAWDPAKMLRAPEQPPSSTSASATEVSRSQHPPAHGRSSNPDTSRGSELKITSLKVTFSGFALYLDSSGRFSALRLARVTQELLPESVTLLLAANATKSFEGREDADRCGDDPAREGLRQGTEYEIEFDLSVPGWLPGTFHSRFGNTFYCLDVQACYSDQSVDQDDVAPIVTVSRSKSLTSPRAKESKGNEAPFPTTVDETARPSQRRLHPSVSADRTSFFSGRRNSNSNASPQKKSSVNAASSVQQGDPSAAPEPSQSKESWLSKRAKQLQIKARTTVASSPLPSPTLATPMALRGSSSGSNEMPAKAKIDERAVHQNDSMDSRRSARALEWARQWRQKQDLAARDQQGGKGKISRSDPLAIVIRRCRDVVPVPVARLAIIGPEGLPDAAMQDPPPLSTSVSRVNSQKSPMANNTLPNEAVPPPAPDEDAAAAAAAAVAPKGTDSESHAMSPAAEAGNDSGATDGIHSTSAYKTKNDAAQPTQQPIAPPRHIVPEPLPSALDMSTDPEKRAAQLTIPSTPRRGSSHAVHGDSQAPSRGGGIRQGSGAGSSSASGGGASEGSGAVPMRHFLHRPVLHPPTDCSVDNLDGQGLPFSLTLSIPSHAQIDGPKSDMLTFGVQIEVGKTRAWNQVREQGGLRLRDMQLVCVQTERHTSAPSRTFCHSYPLPPNPKIEPIDLPLLGDPHRGLQGRSYTSTDVRMRAGYDVSLVRHHLELVKQGLAPHPVENNVERIRTCVVGPPPTQADKGQSGADDAKGATNPANSDKSSSRKGKERERLTELQRDKEREAREKERQLKEREREAKERQRESEREQKEREKREKKEKRKTMPSMVPSSSSSSSGGFATPSFLLPPPSTPGDQAAAPTSRLASFGRSISPSNLGATPLASSNAGRTPSPTQGEAAPRRSESAIPGSSSGGFPGADANGAADSSGQEALDKGKKPSRGRRAYQSAIRGLSSFATAVMDISLVDYEGADGPMAGGGAEAANLMTAPDDDAQFKGPRATYSFAGSDGHGVDLTRGRVRMTVNLPLVTHSASIAKRDGTAQLAADFDSPYARVRHKLKVKLGFGFGSRPLGGEGEWGQALTLCVPVRFTEAAPIEVREQFAPLPIAKVTATSAAAAGGLPAVPPLPPPTPTTSGTSASTKSHNASSGGSSAAVPILPSYNQLFREDGSRLADEGEDLPQYPGPKAASTAMSAIRMSPSSNSRSRLAQLPKRGSVTAPSPRQDQHPSAFTHLNEIADSSLSPSSSSTRLRSGSVSNGQQQQLSSSSDVMEEAGLPMANVIAPSRVVDEAILIQHASQEDLDAARREQALEFSEMNEEAISSASRIHGSTNGSSSNRRQVDDTEGEEPDAAEGPLSRLQQPQSQNIDLDAGRAFVRESDQDDEDEDDEEEQDEDDDDDDDDDDARSGGLGVYSGAMSGLSSPAIALPLSGDDGDEEDIEELSSLRGTSPLNASADVRRASLDVDSWTSANED